MSVAVCAEPVEEVIRQAEEMSLQELYQKAIEESDGKRFDAVGNSGRGQIVLPLLVEELQKIDPSYRLDYEGGWQQLRRGFPTQQMGVWTSQMYKLFCNRS